MVQGVRVLLQSQPLDEASLAAARGSEVCAPPAYTHAAARTGLRRLLTAAYQLSGQRASSSQQRQICKACPLAACNMPAEADPGAFTNCMPPHIARTPLALGSMSQEQPSAQPTVPVLSTKPVVKTLQTLTLHHPLGKPGFTQLSRHQARAGTGQGEERGDHSPGRGLCAVLRAPPGSGPLGLSPQPLWAARRRRHPVAPGARACRCHAAQRGGALTIVLIMMVVMMAMTAHHSVCARPDSTA